MRAAPAVDALLADGRQARWLIVGLHLGAMLALLGWAASWQLSGGTPMLAMAAKLPFMAWWLALPGLLLAGWLGHWQAGRLLPTGAQRLRWDGQAWHWLLDGQVRPLAAVSVQIDLGRHLLLRLQGLSPRQAGWAVASARAAGRDWHGLRVALQYHALALPAPGLPGDGSATGR